MDTHRGVWRVPRPWHGACQEMKCRPRAGEGNWHQNLTRNGHHRVPAGPRICPCTGPPPSIAHGAGAALWVLRSRSHHGTFRWHLLPLQPPRTLFTPCGCPAVPFSRLPRSSQYADRYCGRIPSSQASGFFKKPTVPVCLTLPLARPVAQPCPFPGTPGRVGSPLCPLSPFGVCRRGHRAVPELSPAVPQLSCATPSGAARPSESLNL